MAGKTFSRTQIQKIVDGMTARDIFSAMPSQADTGGLKGAEVAGAVFDAAAARQGHGEQALDRVSAQDAIWLAQEISEAINVGGPKANGTEESPPSADIGDSAQS
jgi:hypothetical protein